MAGRPNCEICQTNRYMVKFENPTRYECSNTEAHKRIARHKATESVAHTNRGGRKKR